MKHLVMVGTVMALTACATLRYQEPAQGSRARVRFVTTSIYDTVLRTYDDANCTQNETEWMRLRVGSYLHSNPKTLGMPLWRYHENAAKEVFVAANTPINGLFIGSEARFTCGTPFFFAFLENHDYEVKFQLRPDQCHVVISQFVRRGEHWSLAEVVRFDNQINASNRGCFAQFKKLRLF